MEEGSKMRSGKSAISRERSRHDVGRKQDVEKEKKKKKPRGRDGVDHGNGNASEFVKVLLEKRYVREYLLLYWPPRSCISFARK